MDIQTQIYVISGVFGGVLLLHIISVLILLYYVLKLRKSIKEIKSRFMKR